MYKRLFYEELSRSLAERVEIATDMNLIEGIIVRVTPDFLVIDRTDEYSPGEPQYVMIHSINSVRFA